MTDPLDDASTVKVGDEYQYEKYSRTAAVLDPYEMEDAPRPPVATDRFDSCTADRFYLAMSHYNVTEETFAKEERRKDRDYPGESGTMPPGGLVCSGRLGEVSKLL